MRLIGYLPEEAAARTFADFLFVEGIRSKAEHEPERGWAIWVEEEDKVQNATSLLQNFQQNPADPRFKSAVDAATRARQHLETEQRAYRKRLRGRSDVFRPLTGYGFGPLSFALIVASTVVFFLSRFGTETERIMGLFITDFNGNGGWSLPEVRHGQIWRLITPIFIHFGPLHIIFNMLWLRDLGSMIEARQSSLYLMLLVVVIAACSNVAQFYIGASPLFGGMSGVVYGLLGYIWIRGKFNPGSGLYVHSSTVSMMIIWFFVCLFGLIGHVANTAHAVGLVMGMAWGFLSSRRWA